MVTIAKVKALVSVLAVTTLGACLGGGGGSEDNGTLTLAEYTARFADLQSEQGALTLTPEAKLFRQVSVHLSWRLPTSTCLMGPHCAARLVGCGSKWTSKMTVLKVLSGISSTMPKQTG